MSPGAVPPLVIVLLPLSVGLAIFFLAEEQVRVRSALNLGAAVLKVMLVFAVIWGVYQGERYHLGFELAPGFEFVLRIDALALLFVTLSAVLWLLTTIYAIAYLEGSPHRSRFFGFFSICVAATTGIALAGNLLTLIVFYEMLTLSAYPLVVHRGTPAALRAGATYLRYTIAGGMVLLVAIVWLHTLAGPIAFAEEGGALAELGREHDGALRAIFALFVIGFGVKAALVPLHGWLPQAMVAPAPVSALLHAVAVVKAGAFGLVRIVYDVYGSDRVFELGVGIPLAALAAVTIVYGSIQALRQEDLKRRLAYSTVSQLSYIVLGISLFGPIATMGGLVHLVHQGIMKITLFFCAGNLAETYEIHKVGEMRGIAWRMPWTMAAFTLAALGMIALPPLAGFISKWYLGVGGVLAGQYWVVPLLLVSSLLNAAYFLPLIYRAWFLLPESPPPEPQRRSRRGWETDAGLLLPPLVTAALTLLLGLFAGTEFSPLHWVDFIARQEYPP